MRPNLFLRYCLGVYLFVDFVLGLVAGAGLSYFIYLAIYRKNIINREYDYSSLFENNPDGILIVSQDGKIVKFNKAYERLFAEIIDKLIGSFVWDIHSDITKQHVKSILLERSVEPLEFDSNYTKLDGSLLPYLVRAKFVNINGGVIVATVRDFTLEQEYRDNLKLYITALDAKKLEASNLLKQLQEEHARLAESESRLAEAQKIAKIATWTYDIASDSLQIAGNAGVIFGMKDNACLTRDQFVKYIHHEDVEYATNAFNELLQHGKPLDIVYRLVSLDGYERYVRACASLVTGKDGKPLKTLCTVQDISNIKALEKSVKNERFRYSNIMNFSTECIVVFTSSGDVIDFSLSFAHLIGYEDSELQTLNIFEFDADGSDDNFSNSVLRFSSTEEFVELKLKKKNGLCADVEVRLGSMKYDNQVCIYASIHDVTSRKLLETRLKLAIKAGGIGIWDLDVLDNTLLWDNRMFELYGLSCDELLTPEEVLKSRVHPYDKVVNDALIDSALKGEQDYNCEFRIVYRNETIHYIKASAVVIRDQNGMAIRMIGANWDITEQKMFELHLQELVAEETNKRLSNEKIMLQQSKMALMGEMIGAIAHQWRQPLNALAIKVQDTVMAHRFGEIDDNYIGTFKKNSMDIIRGMSQTIEDFRSFFKPIAQKERFTVSSALDDTLNIVGPLLKNSSIAVELSESPKNDEVYGFKNGLAQVFLVLISNSKDALVENKIEKPVIKIVTLDYEESVTILITDNGGGISEDIMDRIFEPYFTTKEQGKGTGIGLYMAKEIVERHMGGKIFAENCLDGVKFSVELQKADFIDS